MLALLLLAQGPAAPAQLVTAEEAMGTYRRVIKPVAQLDCPKAEGGEVVVCARRDAPSRYRLPLPSEPEAGARIRGDIPSGTDAMNAGGCLRMCSRPLDLLNTRDGGAVGKAIGGLLKAVEGDD